MDLPKLTVKMTLQNPVRSPDGGGGYNTTWADLGTHWAQLSYRTGRTGSGETSPVARQPVEITLRATPPDHPMHPKPGQALVQGARRYIVSAVSPNGPTPLYLTCLAELEVIV